MTSQRILTAIAGTKAKVKDLWGKSPKDVDQINLACNELEEMLRENRNYAKNTKVLIDSFGNIYIKG